MTNYWSPLRRAAVAAALALGLAVTAGAVPAGAATLYGGSNVHCDDHVVKVRISDPGPADQRIWGRLCYAGPFAPDTVQLLVPGGTYGHVYWDLPYGDGSYSYARTAASAGYATFNVDRVGTGHSSHPPGALLDIPSGAIALHDVITALRAGRVGGHAFRRVVWVGHSIGSQTAWDEAQRYHDIDAAILTGALHGFNLEKALEGVAALYPAVQDPRFADSGLDPGYQTTRPGTRMNLYHHPDTTDPNVVAADEANKETMTTGELNGSGASVPHQITAPVLLLAGGNDGLFCTGVIEYSCADPETVRAYESQFYLPETRLHVVIIPGAGHSVALSTVASQASAAMLDWSRSVVAP